MEAKLVRVGNSKGVRLPKALLEEAGLEELVTLRIVEGGLLVEPRAAVRSGWSDAARSGSERGDDTDAASWPPTRFDEAEWVWEPAGDQA